MKKLMLIGLTALMLTGCKFSFIAVIKHNVQEGIVVDEK
jgi:uncharacterized protein YcfL